MFPALPCCPSNKRRFNPGAHGDTFVALSPGVPPNQLKVQAPTSGGFKLCMVSIAATVLAVCMVAFVRRSALLNSTTPAPPVAQFAFRSTSAEPPVKVRRGSFLVIGDWGFDEKSHGNVNDTDCQKAIADAMERKMEELGDVQFIINVGDSFYPSGVKSKDDPQWDTKWRNIFPRTVRSVPWYSVYGNHDYHIDPCSCSSDPADCAQVNWDIDDRDYFYMPGYNWYKAHPELNLEVVGLDLNKYFAGWNRSMKASDLVFEDCQWSKCKQDCLGNSDARAIQGFNLFADRFEHSPFKNLLVFSHYPTDYFSSVPDFLANLSRADKHDIVYVGGHRHNVDNTSTWNTSPNQNWVVGGGGGWSCDGPSQGFLVVTIDADYNMHTTPELVDYNICCPPPSAAAE